MYLPFNFEAFEREAACFDRMLPDLRRQYLNWFVAIYNGSKVDEDTNRFRLAKRIRFRYGREFVLIRKVREERVDYIYFDSPE